MAGGRDDEPVRALGVGQVVHVRFAKWGGRPHWEMEMRFLGDDAYGSWLGSAAGMPMSRPGRSARTAVATAVWVPTAGTFVATFYAAGGEDAVYVDITDRPRLDGDVLRAVDLDLDVVLPRDGGLYIDDEDEFAEHRVEYGYPPEVVAAAETSCAAVARAIAAGEEPWATVGHAWATVAARYPLAPVPAARAR
jgi:hypothetical protein